jgi:four helix bundle protein
MENQERTFNFFRFEDLRIYHKALDYVQWVHNTLVSFPETNNNVIGLAFMKASLNIAVNIAEGSGRNKSQFVYYLKLAKSSIRECVVLSTIAHQQGLLTIENEETSRNFLIEISKMVGALIASLQRIKRQDGDDEDETVENEESPNLY